jgi:purine-binding chemotaxis protein CheW
MNALTQADKVRAGLAAAAAAQQTQYLTFMLGAEMFAIGILAVKEIIEYGGVTMVPMMPACIRGVINLRGAVVPVVDLAVRFGRPEAAVTKRTCIIIIETESNGEKLVIGMVVDAVNAVLDIPASEIEPAPSFGARVRPDFLQGMGKVNGKFVLLLNAQQVLSEEEIGTLAQAGLETQE